MTQEVISGKKKPGLVEGMMGGLVGTAGSLVGSYYGGPAGGAVGGQVGGAVGNAISGQGAGGDNVPTNPRDRAMAQMGNDPTHALQQGKAAAAKLDPQTQQEVSPILDEALKRAFEQRKSQTGVA